MKKFFLLTKELKSLVQDMADKMLNDDKYLYTMFTNNGNGLRDYIDKTDGMQVDQILSPDLNNVILYNNVWKSNTSILSHYHNDCIEYIYVLTGKLLVTVGTKSNIILPPEDAQDVSLEPTKLALSLNGWYCIDKNTLHSIITIEKSHFITKFVKV